jgi:hypothetical protein
MTPEDEKMLADLDELAKMKPNYFAGALQGAIYGWVYGFLTDKPAKGNRLKYGAYGAGVMMFAQFAGHAFMKKTDEWAHAHEKELFSPVPAPRSPVVTKGYFAGSPRPLYHAGMGTGRGSHYVGAPPPDRDYSFTRRPGFNSKDY